VAVVPPPFVERISGWLGYHLDLAPAEKSKYIKALKFFLPDSTKQPSF